jgi:hypothetical protein
LNCTGPVNPFVLLELVDPEALVEEDDELELDELLDPVEEVVDPEVVDPEVVDPEAVEPEPVVPLEVEELLDELARIGGIGPRLQLMSLPMLVNKARVNKLCSTVSRPAWT